MAVKVIDKQKFPSNKEAALRTEVEILQKVIHPGVVEFAQMLETPERVPKLLTNSCIIVTLSIF